MPARSVSVPAAPDVHRRRVAYLLVPRELARLRAPLTRFFADDDSVEVVLDRRRADGRDRRRRRGPAPAGVERRVGERRAGLAGVPAGATDLELPWRARRHADRLRLVVRDVPVHTRDEAVDDRAFADALLWGDDGAEDELRLRHHEHVHACVEMLAGRRHADDLTDAVLEAATADLAMHPDARFSDLLGTWTGRVVLGR